MVYHFKDKRGLYVAAITSLLEDLDKFVAPRPDELTGEQIVRGALGRYFEFIARYPVAMLSLLRVGLHAPDLRVPYLGARQIGLARIVCALDVSCESSTRRLRMSLRGWMGYTWLAPASRAQGHRRRSNGQRPQFPATRRG